MAVVVDTPVEHCEKGEGPKTDDCRKNPCFREKGPWNQPKTKQKKGRSSFQTVQVVDNISQNLVHKVEDNDNLSKERENFEEEQGNRLAERKDEERSKRRGWDREKAENYSAEGMSEELQEIREEESNK